MPPLGLCTLASFLRSRGHDVHICDLDLEVKARDEDPNKVYTTLFCEALDEFLPDVAGFTSMYNNSLQAEQLIAATRAHLPNVTTVAGGPHFGALCLESLARIPALDFAVEGEGEIGLLKLLDALDNGTSAECIPRVHGRNTPKNHCKLQAPLIDLGGLPPMWKTLEGVLRLERYAATIPPASTRRVVYIEAGRGCPFACKFCATAPFWQHKYRVKTPQQIVDEIRFLHENFGYDSFILVHDLLTANHTFVSEFCDVMMDAHLPVEWMANSRTDIPLHGLLPKIKGAGCWKLFFGVESASARLQESFDKHLDVDEAVEHIEDLGRHGLSATCSFVFGFPDETPSETSATIGLGARMKLLGVETVQFHRLRLFPPSRYCCEDRSGQFDLESLRIEYPFLDITQEEISAIAKDPRFFAGYSPLVSSVGSATQLAQVEMFFHHAVAIAPLTVAAISLIDAEGLLQSFYYALEHCGPLVREKLDWEMGDLLSNCFTIWPLLECLINVHVLKKHWQAQLVQELTRYEERRLRYVTNPEISTIESLAAGQNWVAYPCGLDLVDVIARLRQGSQLDPEVFRRGAVVFCDERSGFSAYLVEERLITGLIEHQPRIVAAFETEPNLNRLRL
jgi:radical SAM superfamily enzyme YgiQ (UPF0313 family)